MSARIYFGTAGWSYRDWEGIVYPKGAGSGALGYWAPYVDVLEINTSFYRPPSAKMVVRWLDAVRDHPTLKFTAKLYRGFTHRPCSEWNDEDRKAFLEGLRPLEEEGRLGAVLVQFPFYFDANPAHGVQVQRIAELFGHRPLVLEVRHRSWLRPGAYAVIEKLGYAFCNIDHPESSTSIPREPRLTSSLGYFRLHGRNRDAWFSKKAGRDETYNYLYSPQELDEIASRIESLRERAREIYVITNNHFAGQAAVNILELKSRIPTARQEGGTSRSTPPLPETLIEHYPRLRLPRET